MGFPEGSTDAVRLDDVRRLVLVPMRKPPGEQVGRLDDVVVDRHDPVRHPLVRRFGEEACTRCEPPPYESAPYSGRTWRAIMSVGLALSSGEGRRMSESEIVIAVTCPRWMEVRPEAETRRDLELVAEMDPRVRVVREEYEDTEELRTRRGTPPFDGLEEQQAPIPERVRDLLGEAEIILGLDLPFELLALAPNLRWVQCMGAGVGPLISCGIPTDRVRLTTGSGNNSVSISEFVIARLLGIWKRFRDLDAKQRA